MFINMPLCIDCKNRIKGVALSTGMGYVCTSCSKKREKEQAILKALPKTEKDRIKKHFWK